jgi:hypothetical protein
MTSDEGAECRVDRRGTDGTVQTGHEDVVVIAAIPRLQLVGKASAPLGD